MQPRSLDHVALWVTDRDRLARALEEQLGVHVIERSERFTLLGSDARRGKLTLFDGEGPRDPSALVHVALRVSQRAPAVLDVGEGLRVVLVRAPTEVEYDIDHVALRSNDPDRAAREYVPLGFAPAEPGPSGAPRVEVGGAWLEFHDGDPGDLDRSLLNHVAVLVESAAEAQELGADVLDVVDAANTFAVFVRGPDGIKIEYVEHKPEFSLE